jgi:hypothetical protein
MIELFWNIRSLGKIGRLPALANRIKENHVDVVGVVETKKKNFTPGFLKSVSGNTLFNWLVQPAKGSAGGILVGANSDMYVATLSQSLEFLISVMMLDKKTGFSWKLVVVYGSPYEEGKQAFIEELYSVVAHWQGPTVIAGDFNLTRFASDKSNGIINHKWADAFNAWIST